VQIYRRWICRAAALSAWLTRRIQGHRESRPATREADQRLTLVMLNEDARFIFPQGDTYWSGAVAAAGYEPEIDWLLRRAADRPYALIDCGANYGYWSILASSRPYGSHAALAIEPSTANFALLVDNAKANGGRFRTLHRAVLDESGKKATLFGRQHFGLSLRTDWHPDENDRFEQVETISIDDAADRYLPNRKYPALIKIDVEGSETEAIKGARRLIAEGALVIYEDHGKEAMHPASRYVLAQEGIAVWSVDENDRPTRITALEQVAAIKVGLYRGYNFFACKRTSPWSALFEPAAAQPGIC